MGFPTSMAYAPSDVGTQPKNQLSHGVSCMFFRNDQTLTLNADHVLLLFQVETLKTKGSLVKAEISEYVTNRTEQVSNFLAELAAKQQLVEDCIKTIKLNLMSSHITEQITDYSLQRISVAELVKLELGSCVLVEKFVQLKGNANPCFKRK